MVQDKREMITLKAKEYDAWLRCHELVDMEESIECMKVWCRNLSASERGFIFYFYPLLKKLFLCSKE
jgi:hypothetical protein